MAKHGVKKRLIFDAKGRAERAIVRLYDGTCDEIGGCACAR